MYLTLTLNKEKQYQNQSIPESPKNIHPQNLNSNQQKNLVQYRSLLLADCCISKSFFNNDSQQFQINKDIKEQNKLEYIKQGKQTLSNKKKNKIELSLKKERNKSQTPIRYHKLQNSTRNRSQSKRLKEEINRININKESQVIVNLQHNNYNNLKSWNNLKEESIKPSTNISSKYNSGKKSNESNKKIKLTLSNLFKSQIQFGNEKHNVNQNSCQVTKKVGSNQVLIDQSFMTAKLKNIYGQISYHDSCNHSNIVFYNKLMNEEEVWKSPRRQQKDAFIHKQDENNRQLQRLPEISQFTKIPFQTSVKKHHCGKQIEQHIQQDMERFKSKQRRWIGQYAKTIKTIKDESKSHEEVQSVVLYRLATAKTNMMQNIYTPVNRGSIKQYPSNSAQSLNYRPYGSMSYQNAYCEVNKDFGSAFVGLTDNPIYEGSIDSSERQSKY